MSIRNYEYHQNRARSARYEASALRKLHTIATCGLPMKLTGINYGTYEVSRGIAMRVADMYLVWAAEYEAIADGIEQEMQAMFVKADA